MRVGPIPEPTHAPPAVGFDDVTKGYVPWSTSSSVPCDPSSRTVLALFERRVEQQAGVGDAVLETLCLRQQGVDHLGSVERLAVVDLDEHLVLEFECALDLFGQQRLVEHVGDADPDAGDLVLVARADAAACGADLLAARVALDNLVHRHVIGHQQVRIGGDQQPLGVDATILETLQLSEQHTGVDDYSVADDVGDAGRQDARGDEV